jgi:hypothetical protein
MPHGEQARLCTCSHKVLRNGRKLCARAAVVRVEPAGSGACRAFPQPSSPAPPRPRPCKEGLLRRAQAEALSDRDGSFCRMLGVEIGDAKEGEPQTQRRAPAPRRAARSGRKHMHRGCMHSSRLLKPGHSTRSALGAAVRHARVFGSGSLPASGVYACLACRKCSAREAPGTDCACQVNCLANLRRIAQLCFAAPDLLNCVGGQVLSAG